MKTIMSINMSIQMRRILVGLFSFVWIHDAHAQALSQNPAVPMPQSKISFLQKVSKNWGLSNSIESFGIGITSAWKHTTGDRKIVVAIIDTGIDYTHPDLIGNLFRNPGESGLDSKGLPKRNNKKDDDGDGFIDNEIGWDFVDNDGKPFDAHGHGTHIAGIVGGRGEDRVIGVSPDVSLMILKYYDPNASGEQNLKNTIRAINYAVDHGADIINYSAGGPSFSEDEHKAISRARDKGILFIAAAGNERQNADRIPYYPASYSLDNIISVTAIDPTGKILPSSNYGIRSVHIAAPGKSVISSTPNRSTSAMTGTSQATAFVTGVAALIYSKMDKKIGYKEVRKVILETGRIIPSLAGKTSTGKTVNAEAALASVSEPKPAPAKVTTKKVETTGILQDSYF